MQQVLKSKILWTVLLSIMLSIFLLAVVPTAWAQTLTATLRIENIEDTMLAPKELSVTYRPLSEYGITGMSDPGFITPMHVLAEALVQIHGQDNVGEKILIDGGMLQMIEGSLGSSADEPDAWWMWAANQSMPVHFCSNWDMYVSSAANQYPVSDGDYIDFLGTWVDPLFVADPLLSFFHSQTFSANVEQSFEVQLIGLNAWWDAGIPLTEGTGLEGAEILIDALTDTGSSTQKGATTPSGIITDARGVAELSFDEPGTYLLSAKRPIASPSSPNGTVSDIARPFALVTVTENGGGGTNPPIFDLPQWDSSRGNTHNSGITTAQTPGTTQSGQALWSHRVADGSRALSPVKIGDYLYIAGFADGRSTLFKFNAATQTGTGAARLVASTQLAQPTGQAAFLAAGSGKIFVPLNGGRVQAFDAASLAALWTSDLLDAGWQTWGALSYYDGYLYGAAGRDRFMLESDGVFFCLNAETGEKVWTYSSTSTQRERGFYWSGAAHISIVAAGAAGDAVLFAGDDGVLVSHRAGSDGSTTAGASGVIDTAPLPGGVRSSVLFVPAAGDALGGAAYVATRNGYFARVAVAADGSFVGATVATSLSGEGSTSTPVVYRNRAYLVSGELQNELGEPGNGYVDVIDATSLQRLRSVQLPGFSQSSPLLSTAGATATNGFEVSLFVALNSTRDDVVRVVDSEIAGTAGAQQIRAESFFRAGGSFTLSSVSACEAGRLYYTDGRGYFTAIAASNAPPPANDNPQNDTDNDTGNDAGNDARNDTGNDTSNDTGNDTANDTGNDDYNPYAGGGGNTGSTNTTRTANTGPKTGDDANFAPYIIAAVLAALIILAIVAKLIADGKKEKAKKAAQVKEESSNGDAS